MCCFFVLSIHQDDPSCLWFTFYFDDEACLLFETCDEMDDGCDCTSGQRFCSDDDLSSGGAVIQGNVPHHNSK